MKKNPPKKTTTTYYYKRKEEKKNNILARPTYVLCTTPAHKQSVRAQRVLYKYYHVYCNENFTKPISQEM